MSDQLDVIKKAQYIRYLYNRGMDLNSLVERIGGEQNMLDYITKLVDVLESLNATDSNFELLLKFPIDDDTADYLYSNFESLLNEI